MNEYKDHTRSYKFLLMFYLREQVYGRLGEFNKEYFPNLYEEMRKELEEEYGVSNDTTK